MIKKIILGVVCVIIILFIVVLANSSIQGYSRRNNINCNNNCITEDCIMTENCINSNYINKNCYGTGTQQRNQNCSNLDKNYTQTQCKRKCH